MTDQTLPIIDKRKCTICGQCVEECPELALGIQEGQLLFTQPQACTFCGTCEEICPQGAVRLEYVIRWAQKGAS
jgi:ferredoxin